MGRPLRLLTNAPWLANPQPHGEWRPRDERSAIRRLQLLVGAWPDIVLLNCDFRGTILACLLKRLFRRRLIVIGVDLVLNRPGTMHGRLLLPFKRWCFSAIDTLVVYSRDNDVLRRLYGLRDDQVTYVPFKVNAHDHARDLSSPAVNFFLACGHSFRDYSTLAAAFTSLPYTCIALADWPHVRRHGSRIANVSFPPQVQAIIDDGSAESWNTWISRSLAVVLPIEPDALSPAGISTYLVAMAMGKCVIITESAATRGVLPEGAAVIVPPKDPVALRDAIVRVAEDHNYRIGIAAAGRDYALSLGGEDRLARDILDIVRNIVTTYRTSHAMDGPPR